MSENLASTLLRDLSRYEDLVAMSMARLREARDLLERQRRLVKDMQDQYPQWFSGENHVERVDVTGEEEGDEQADAPRGQDAVLTVISDSPEEKMSTTQILAEMTRREWASERDPEGAVRAAIRRLRKDNKIRLLDEKDGRAHVFALVGGKSEAPDESGASVNNSDSAVDAAGPEREEQHHDRGGDHHPAIGVS